MKKSFNFLAIVAIAISLFMPEIIQAQNEPAAPATTTVAPVTQTAPTTSNAPATAAVVKSKKSNLETQFTTRVAGDYRRGVTLFGGATVSSKDGKGRFPEMSLLASFGIPGNSGQTTSFGLTYVVYPKRFWGFGFDAGYFYRCKVDATSIVQFRAPVTDLLKNIASNWTTQYLVLAPIIEFSIPIGESIRIGSKINPLGFALWDYIPENNSFTHAKQWYDIDLLYFSMKL